MKTVGIVLAGGQSKRFGEPKALALRQGKPFLFYSVEALRSIVDEIVVVATPYIQKQLLCKEVLWGEDDPNYKGKGPLAGIYSAMVHHEATWYIVLPCDTPFIHETIVKTLKQQADDAFDAIVPYVNGRLQPLIAMYHYRVKSLMYDCLQQGEYRMCTFLSSCRVKQIEMKEEQPFMNINTKEQFHKWIG
ncbi:molybdenum cofactor guanylyltransferase [Anoxybacillus kestanbolensis]|uniref:molybdenum cofactor guanylyltransferase n=1 Tax=Anoxybacillus kestanbolensis TaxID=227476 RepID=UPI003D1DB80B